MNLSKYSANILFGFSVMIVISPVFFLPPFQEQEPVMKLRSIGGFLYFLIPVTGVIGYLIYANLVRKKAEQQWKAGVFDDKQMFSKEVLLQAYIRLGGLMLRKDQDDMKGKMAYLHRYFNSYFPEEFTDFGNLLKLSFNHPVDLNSITPWLKTYLRSTSQRSQLLYFLAGLSAVDGSINPKEKQYLKELSDLLDLSLKDFNSIMAMYEKYEDAYHDQFKQERRQTPSKSRSQYQREKAAEILGVSVNASADEVKKAYRSLAKVHHPDRFATESESQQKIAKERFVKIQLAYELLLEG